MTKTVSFLVSATCVLTAVLSQADEWPQYRGIYGDGKSSEAISETPWPANGPKQLWKIETPLGFSSFSIAGGRAFTIIARDGTEHCLAVDAHTGEELWTFKMGSSDYKHGGGNSGAAGNKGGDGPRSTPSSDGDRVYIYGSHMILRCLDAKTGRVNWEHNVPQEYAGRNIKWFNAVSPLLDDSNVYVPGGGPGQSFLAFNKINGELVWKNGDEVMTHATPRLAQFGDSRQIVFFMKSGLVSVGVADGSEKWRGSFPFSVSTAASPVVENDLVYCSAGYGVGAGLFQVAGEEADELWYKKNKLMNHWSTPLVHDGHLYGIFEFKKYGNAPLQCVEMKTGEIKWSQRGFGPGNCILVGDKLVVLADDGQLVIVAAKPHAYEELARAKVVDGKCWSTPSFSDGRVYVRSVQEGACVKVNAATPSLLSS